MSGSLWALALALGGSASAGEADWGEDERLALGLACVETARETMSGGPAVEAAWCGCFQREVIARFTPSVMSSDAELAQLAVVDQECRAEVLTGAMSGGELGAAMFAWTQQDKDQLVSACLMDAAVRDAAAEAGCRCTVDWLSGHFSMVDLMDGSLDARWMEAEAACGVGSAPAATPTPTTPPTAEGSGPSTTSEFEIDSEYTSRRSWNLNPFYAADLPGSGAGRASFGAGLDTHAVWRFRVGAQLQRERWAEGGAWRTEAYTTLHLVGFGRSGFRVGLAAVGAAGWASGGAGLGAEAGGRFTLRVPLGSLHPTLAVRWAAPFGYDAGGLSTRLTQPRTQIGLIIPL